VYDRVTVYEAAKRLGVSEGAVRQRIHRGKLETDKDETGRVYVYLTGDNRQNNGVKTDVTDQKPEEPGLLDELRDRIRFLEDELQDRKDESRRKDSIIMSLTQRVPELEAAPDTRESPVNTSQSVGTDAGASPSLEDDSNKSWWSRLFGP
jgi:hypothetical protein